MEKWLYRCPRCRREFIRKPPAVGTWYRCPRCADPGDGGAVIGGVYHSGGTVHLGFVRVADEKDLKRLKAKPDPVPEAPAKAWALFRCKCGREFAAMPEEYTMQARVPCPDCGEPARPVRQAKPEEIGAAGGRCFK